MNALITFLDGWFGQKAPKMPQGLKDFLIKIAPWGAIIGAVLSALAALSLFGVSSSFAGFYGAYVGNAMLAGIFSAALAVLYFLAFPGLKKMAMAGWTFMFYAELVSLVQSLVMGNIVGFVIGAAIGFWILFQLRPAYMGGMTSSGPTMPA